VLCTRHRSHGETTGGGLCGDVYGEEETAVQMEGSRDLTIKRVRGFWPAKLKTEPYGLGFSPVSANPSVDHKVGIWGGVGAVIGAIARCVGEIARGASLGPKN
jgi:hypothetical protein